MVKSEAYPLLEDDFDLEVKSEAAKYSAKQRDQAEREQLKAENKRRRLEGLDPLRRARNDKKEIKTPQSSDEDEENGRSFLLGSGDESDSWVVRDARGVKRKRASRGNDELSYEGQVKLPFNPLYELAGMADPTRERMASYKRRIAIARDQLVAVDKPHQSKEGNRNLVASDLEDSIPDARTALPADPDGEDVKPTSATDERPASEEVEDEDYDYDDDIIIPGMASEVAKTSHAADISKSENGVSDAEDEGGYSEDELFARTSASDNEASWGSKIHTLDSKDLFRPNLFSQADHLPQAGPLYLDNDGKDIAVPASLNRYLKEYQRKGVQFFYDKYAAGRGAVLGDDMGLGKTIQVVAFLSAIMRKTGRQLADHQRRKRRIRETGEDLSPKTWPTALIICPKFLIRNWQRELDTWGYFEVAHWQSDNWAHSKTAFSRGYLDIILSSYETARNTIEQLKDMPFSVVVADEAHRLKEPRAAITLAMKKIQCPSCFALSGTIVQNRLEEMWSILDFVDRGYAGTLSQWRNFVVNPIKKGHRHEGTVAEVVTAVMRLGVMHQKVLPHFYLRRDKRLIADELPDKRDLVVFCPLAERQIKAYEAFIASDDVQFILKRNDPCECGSDHSRSHCCHRRTTEGETVKDVLLKSINALSKVANHLGLLYHAKDDNEHTREVNRRIFKICTGEDYDGKQHNVVEAALDPANCGKWALLSELLKQWKVEGEENKVLIFSNSVRLLKMIAEFISTSSTYRFDMITGEVNIDDRMSMVDRFQDPAEDQFILLISTMAGGVGLNLTAANKVVIFDPAWNPANDLQAMDRAFRIGQKRTVDVYRMIGQGTLEELMYERQIQKQQRSRQLNEGTFESRIHQGLDRGRTVEEQGELYGTHNIFRFDKNGFVPGRLERVRQAEDRFVQDLIEAEYDSDEDVEDEAGAAMREVRLERDQAKAKEAALHRRNDTAVLQTILGDDGDKPVRKEDDVLASFGISSHEHDKAFRDSPEERAIYELGLRLLKSNPEVAAKLKANDLGKLGRAKPKKVDTRIDEEPWKERLKRDKKTTTTVLAELSD